MSYPILSSPGGPQVNGVMYVYDPNLVLNGVSGSFRPAMSSDMQGITGGNITTAFSDAANFDAFSRLRVSDPIGIFDSTFQYNLQPLIYNVIISGGASLTHMPNLASAAMTVGTASGDAVVIQSKQYHRYIPGKSSAIAQTEIPGSGVAGVRKRFGLFDGDNGIFLEQNGVTDVAIVRRTKTSGIPVDNRVTQNNWNIDKFDGNGPSKVTIDLSKATILYEDLQWLGMGRVRVGFDIDGKILYAHEFKNANNLNVPYMTTANLPIRWEIVNTSGSAGATMYATCAAVQSEGGVEADRGYPFCANTPADITASTTRTMLIAIRPASGFGGQTNRVQIVPNEYGILAGNSPVLVEAFYAPVLTGGAWNSANANSAAEWGTGQTIVSPGIPVGSYYVYSSNANRGDSKAENSASRMPICLDISGQNPIPYMITATATTTTSVCRGRIQWTELF